MYFRQCNNKYNNKYNINNNIINVIIITILYSYSKYTYTHSYIQQLKQIYHLLFVFINRHNVFVKELSKIFELCNMNLTESHLDTQENYFRFNPRTHKHELQF